MRIVRGKDSSVISTSWALVWHLSNKWVTAYRDSTCGGEDSGWRLGQLGPAPSAFDLLGSDGPARDLWPFVLEMKSLVSVVCKGVSHSAI